MWVVIQGNPVNGLIHIGPFASREDAIDWADSDNGPFSADWWVAEMIPAGAFAQEEGEDLPDE